MSEKRTMELKKAIIDWLFANKNAWQRTNACREYFRPYIYNADGNYLIGGEEVSDFITEADKLIYGQEVDIMSETRYGLYHPEKEKFSLSLFLRNII